MLNLLASLRETDDATRLAIGQTWGVDVKKMEQAEAAEVLKDAMLDPQKAETVWEKLTDTQRGALQTVLGSGGGKMGQPMFERLHGQIRKMGKGAVEREEPHKNPQSDAEALFYRGLLFEGFEQALTGARAVVYVPRDLADVLPTHKTAYEDLETAVDELPIMTAGEEGPRIGGIQLEEGEPTIPANTTLVDDMATLLAYMQVYGGEIDAQGLSTEDEEFLAAHLLIDDPVRLDFLFGTGINAGLIEITEGNAYPRRAETRRWLEGNRTTQMETLAEGWRKSTLYRDLWHVEGLHPEPTGWPYDPVVARGAVINFLHELVPQTEWWSLDEFIQTIKEIEPDFQRPSGDYESWYIRNEDGEYLHGFESWDAVEGALLEFYINGPMHWLGLVDLAEDAARLTAYGRAFVAGEKWPVAPDPEEPITIDADGTLHVSRRVSRFERFQAMRFTEWVKGDERTGYTYQLRGEAIRRAGEQGINTDHIEAFLNRMLDGQPLPSPVKRLLESWQTGPATAVTVERLMVLRTTAPETLDNIYDDPPLRRYLGARLGPMAVVVRAGQWQALQDALDERGIEVELRE